MAKRKLAAGAILVASTLLAAGCSAAHASDSNASSSPLPVAGTAPPAQKDYGTNLKVEVNKIQAQRSGIAVLYFTVTNTGSEDTTISNYFEANRAQRMFKGGWPWGEPEGSTSAVVLIDPAEGLRYYPLQDTRQGCLCIQNIGDWWSLAPDESVTLYSVYDLPADLDSVTVKMEGIGEREAVKNVPITRTNQ